MQNKLQHTYRSGLFKVLFVAHFRKTMPKLSTVKSQAHEHSKLQSHQKLKFEILTAHVRILKTPKY